MGYFDKTAETGDPGQIFSAVNDLGAVRIGHGIFAELSPEAMAFLKDRDVPLEICLTSNIKTGVVPHRPDHPIRKLFRAGVPLTLNTDDPEIQETTLSRECTIAEIDYMLSHNDLYWLQKNGIRYSFLDDDAKAGTLAKLKGSWE